MRDEGASKRQFVYRNTAEPLPKLRGSERYARDGWTQEPVLQRESMPNRGSGISRNTTGKIIPHLTPVIIKKRAPQPKYRIEDCPVQRQLYRMLRSETTPSGMSVRIVGQCTGQWCGGRIRSFSVVDWCEGKQRGCTRCVTQLRRLERKAARDARQAKARS